MSEAANPYSPPRSNVRLPDQPFSSGQLLAEPRAVSAGSGAQWFAQGWELFKQDIGIWILMILTLLGINILLSFIPFIGSLASSLLSCIFSAGLLMAARAREQGKPVEFTMLFEGFKSKFAPLLGLGALCFVLGIVGGILVGVGVGFLAAASFQGSDPSQLVALFSSPFFAVIVLFGAVYFTLVFMLVWFATPLVALNDVPVFKSLGMSFKACGRNLLPLFVFGLIATVLIIVGALPILLGLLIVLPLLFTTFYKSYQHIFLK